MVECVQVLTAKKTVPWAEERMLCNLVLCSIPQSGFKLSIPSLCSHSIPSTCPDLEFHPKMAPKTDKDKLLAVKHDDMKESSLASGRPRRAATAKRIVQELEDSDEEPDDFPKLTKAVLDKYKNFLHAQPGSILVREIES